MATIDPFGARAGRGIAAKGIAMIDAPVSGGTGRRNQATLSVIVGGDAARRRQVEDLFTRHGQQTCSVSAAMEAASP